MRLKRLCAMCSALLVVFSCFSVAFATDSADVALPYNSLSGFISPNYKTLPDISTNETKVLPHNADDSPSNVRYSMYWRESPYASPASSLSFDQSLTVTFDNGVMSAPVHCIFSLSLLSALSTFTVDNGAPLSVSVLSGGSEYSFDAVVTARFVNQVAWSDVYPKTFFNDTSASDYAAPRIFRVDLNPSGGAWDAPVDGFTFKASSWATISKTGEQMIYAPLIFNCFAWYDVGVSAIDDVVSSILEHVASIDGKMDSVYSAVMQIIEQLQELNKDTDTIVDLLTSIDSHLSNVDSTTSNIYALLRETLTDESTELTNASKQAAETIMQQQDSEQFWTDKNSDTFDAINLNGFSFDSAVLSGLSLVGNIFTSLWNSIGDTVIIYVFPLTLGVALVVIGRISRSGGNGKKKSGGDDG